MKLPPNLTVSRSRPARAGTVRAPKVEIDRNQTIVCIVGNMIAEEKGFAAKVFTSLHDIPIRMISYGGSKHNISVLVNTNDKKATLQALSAKLLNTL